MDRADLQNRTAIDGPQFVERVHALGPLPWQRSFRRYEETAYQGNDGGKSAYFNGVS